MASYLTPKVIAVTTGAVLLGASLWIYHKLTAKEITKFWSDGKSPPCCPPGSEPALVTNYNPRGHTLTVNGLTFYASGEGKQGILFFHDGLGPRSGRTYELIDQLAAQGYTVVMPDFFHGKGLDTVPVNLFTYVWYKKAIWANIENTKWSQINNELNTVVYPYFTQCGVEKIGAIGFCWGTWCVAHASATNKIACGIQCHPSLVVAAKINKENLDDLVAHIKCPQALLPGGNDPPEVRPGGLVEQILKQKSFGEDCIVEDFPKMLHGWVNRGRLDDPLVLRDFKRSFDIIVNFFKKHLQ